MQSSSFVKTEKQKEAVRLITKYHTTLLEGGGRCFVSSQEVITDKGSIAISQLNIGDKVLSMNEELKKMEYKPIEKIHEYKDNQKPMIRLVLKNGKVIVGTEDHAIYFEGGWHKLKYVLESFHGPRNMETDTGF